jgi:glutamine synthetase
VVYSRELLISNRANGYRDIVASIDLSTYRRIPWENDVPFFLISFFDPDTKQPLSVDPRGTLRSVTERASTMGWECYAGVEYEVCRVDNFSAAYFSSSHLVLQFQRYPSSCLASDERLAHCDAETPETLAQKNFTNLQPLTPGSMCTLQSHLNSSGNLLTSSAWLFPVAHTAE